MSNTSSAIAVLFPGVRSSDITNASVEHNVQVLMKEQYDPQKNYHRFHKNIKPVASDKSIALLFIFSDGSNMIADDRRTISKVLKKIVELSGVIL